MGHSSRFTFPLPGRRHKKQQTPAPPPPQPIASGTLTKAQKILGTGGADSASPRGWEAQSNAGISISVSDTTNGQAGFGPRHNGWASNGVQRERRWEEESDIIPAVLNRPYVSGSVIPDGVTDSSSIRRQQSSSTITSYYDKAALPLAISQQTSNSAMAKGLPSKAHQLLDMDGKFTEPPKKPRKKPSRLDLSSLLGPRHRSQKFLHPESNKNYVLGPDMLTHSPSAMSASPAPSPPPIPQRKDRAIRKKLTKESLREKSAQPALPRAAPSRADPGKHHASKANAELYNLYDHYEQRTFADAMEHEFQDPSGYRLEPLPDRQLPLYHQPPADHSGTAYLSPFPQNTLRAAHPSRQSLPAGSLPDTRPTRTGTPSSPASTTPPDCASVSSRHTRTSKASKRTDLSMNEIDLLQNSVLALSSDSEDDYEVSSKSSLMVPPLSDGQASPSSLRSAMSQRNGPDLYDAYRGKPAKRASFATTPQVVPTDQGSAANQGPKISRRSSSLTKSSVKQAQTFAHSTSRLSIGTTSTGRTVAHAPTQSPDSHPASVAKKGAKDLLSDPQFDFPAPPAHRPHRSASVSRGSDQLSPTGVDMYPQSQSRRSSMTHDNGSIRSGTSMGSGVNTGRRGSAPNSLKDDSSGRFMAVTRQEEMLLAALRMKRARMREDILAQYEEDMDRDEHPLRRESTNESISTSGGMSRQSSQSTMRQGSGTLSARPREQGQFQTSTDMADMDDGGHGQLLPLFKQPVYEPNPGTTLDFDDPRNGRSPVEYERRPSKASLPSPKSSSGRQRASLSAMTAPTPRRPQRREGGTSRRGSDQFTAKQNDLPLQILEDPAEDEDLGIPRPDSPITPSDFPAPVSIKNKKQVRLSAVGYYKSSDAGW